VIAPWLWLHERKLGGVHVSAHLIPTDGSELAHRAVVHGLALAKLVGAKVTALTVEGSFNVYAVPTSKDYEISGAFAGHIEHAKAHAGKILDGIAKEARTAGVTCETVQIEQDQPYKAIIEAAEQRACDLLSWLHMEGVGLRQSCLVA
jgi:nucleotide-binding universal stress UspA family protein